MIHFSSCRSPSAPAPGLCPVLCLSHFLPVAHTHHQQLLIENMWRWLCPCWAGSLYLLTAVNVGILCSDHRCFGLRCRNKEEKQPITLFLSQAPADVSGWFLWCSSAPRDLQGCVLLFAVYLCRNGGSLGSYMFTSGAVWPQTLEPSESLLGLLSFWTPVPAESSYPILLCKLYQGIGSYRLKNCLCLLLCIPRKSEIHPSPSSRCPLNRVFK